MLDEMHARAVKTLTSLEKKHCHKYLAQLGKEDTKPPYNMYKIMTSLHPEEYSMNIGTSRKTIPNETIGRKN